MFRGDTPLVWYQGLSPEGFLEAKGRAGRDKPRPCYQGRNRNAPLAEAADAFPALPSQGGLIIQGVTP